MGNFTTQEKKKKKSQVEEKRETRAKNFKELEPRVVAECNLEALKYNLGTLQQYCEPILVTCSNDAFGHGAVQCAKLAASLDVDCFGVSNVKEGIELREGGITPHLGRILVFGEPMQMELAAYCALNLGVIVSCRRSADQLQDWDKLYSGKRKLLTWVLVDAGYTNIGVPVKNACKCIESLTKQREGRESNIVFEGLILRTMDDRINTTYPRIDLELVCDLVQELQGKDIEIPCIIFESNQTLLREWDQVSRQLGKQFQKDTRIFARCSLETYGYAKEDDDEIPPLRTCLTLKAQIRDIRKVNKGEWIGFGEGWQAPMDSFVAVVACGYADGYPAFINQEQTSAYVRCKGASYNIIGEICSNHILIHLGSASPSVSVGDWAVLFGPHGADSRNMEFSRLCDLAEVSPCQTLCHISAKVTKVWASTGATRKHTINRLSLNRGSRKSKSPTREDQSDDRKDRKKQKKSKKNKKKKKKKDKH